MSKRNIFEDVTEKVEVVAPQKRKSARRAIAGWLMVLFALVVLMVVVGGMTRLTDGGLSITEWKPVTGVTPPSDHIEWLKEFNGYRQTPEFRLQDSAMTLEEFKGIFWWEWGHRFLGCFVGLVWFVGFVWFAVRRQIPTGWTGRLVGVGVIQGAVMVSSGLAVNLGLAFIILGLIAWFVFELRRESGELLQARRRRENGLVTLGTVLVIVLFVQILLGALVAGIDAGRSFSTWPDMAGAFLPSESFDYQPMWTNFFENPALVQFNHRLLGYLAFLLGVFAWWKSRKSAMAGVRFRFDWMMVMMFGQMVLGIVTVIYAAPVHAAITHQLGAVALLVLTLQAWFEAAYPVEQKISRG